MTVKSSRVVVSPWMVPCVASSRSRRRMIFPERVLGSASVIFLFCEFIAMVQAQVAPAMDWPYTRKNTYGVFAAYSNDSSHIYWGTANSRKLATLGLSYDRRLFHNRLINVQYSAELLPLFFESDPLSILTDYQTKPTVQTLVYPEAQLQGCANYSQPYSYTDPNTGLIDSGTYVVRCVDREWTYGAGIAPVGFRVNLSPRHRTQFFLDGHLGVVNFTRPVPAASSGSFNFLFDMGMGLEFYRSHSKSLRAETRVHHISDNYTTTFNPGIDNVLFQLTYAFGK